MRARKKQDVRVREVQRWFAREVTCDGKAYAIDEEQAAAVVDESQNTIVVARAGSGKTRTIVAKIVYLIARCGVTQEEIMAFVFNANAAAEINARLSKMCVDGALVMDKEVKIATTFHAFARKIVYEACGGKDKCGKILAGEKEKFIEAIVRKMVKEDMEEEEVLRLTGQMTQFVNRAQQKYLGGSVTIGEIAEVYLKNETVSKRERKFIKTGVECFKRYHWYLLDAKKKIRGLEEYGTDFNLIVSWASKLILAGRGKVREWLGGKRYILIDEYQDFSQLFLAAVEAVREVAVNARLFVVGDDWQAINRFAGSEVEYFKEFEKYFAEDCRRLLITTNYRCDRAVVNTARRFMTKAMREKGKFRAFSRRVGKVVVVNPRQTECEMAVVDYDRRVSGRDEIYKKAAQRMVGRIPKFVTVQYVKTLVEVIKKNRKAESIFLLHRNNMTDIEGVSLTELSHELRWVLNKLGVMMESEYNTKVRVMTMHRSKGLEAEVVILLEADEGVIPKTHPDTLLYGLFGETLEVNLDDQKRLFYVAMTRAKRRLYIMHDPAAGVGFMKYLGRGLEKWDE